MAKFCTNCGASLDDGKLFCTECGTRLDAAVSSEAATAGETATASEAAPPPPPPPPRPAQQAAQPVFAEPVPPSGSKYEPISTGGYVGIFLLLCIPIVGLVLMIVWACGGCRKIAKRNLSRAMLIFAAVGVVLSLILVLLGGSLFNFAKGAIEEAAGSTGITENGIFGGGSGASSSGSEELDALGSVLGALGALTGEESGEGGWDELLGGVADANAQAEEASDGWPATLRPYPDGESTAVASYRTEISGTSRESMLAWIDELRGDGFAFEDFYGFGMSEQDMLGMDGWWATDGNIYLSASYYDGVVTVDHTYELPELSF